MSDPNADTVIVQVVHPGGIHFPGGFLPCGAAERMPVSEALVRLEALGHVKALDVDAPADTVPNPAPRRKRRAPNPDGSVSLVPED